MAHLLKLILIVTRNYLMYDSPEAVSKHFERSYYCDLINSKAFSLT
jgi:hypothetical protein